jgi:CubicO group peptidase (beta-lactamase class C family)
MRNISSIRIYPLLTFTFVISILAFQLNCQQSPATSKSITLPSPPPGVDDLNSFLEEVRERHDLPGMAVAVFNADSLIAVGSAGTRKIKSGLPLVYTDKLQIASIAKTMTATIVAFLIEDSLLSWKSKLADIYPELTPAMDPVYRNVTVEMLLRHTGGLPRWMRNDEIFKSWVKKHSSLNATGKRYEAVKYILSRSSEYTPGSREYYTNDSYLILGNICERVSGKTCEELFQQHIFNPLQMSSSGFGEPWADGTTNNPWGHEKRGNQYFPYDPDLAGYGRIPFGTPYGGIVHGSVIDLAKYGIFHLRGDLGLETRLSTASFHRLHHANSVTAPQGSQVTAAGFFNEGRLDSAGYWTNVQHWGYYARGRTLLWFSPQANIGAVILTNGTDEDEIKGMQPLSEVAISLFKRYRSDTGTMKK